MTTRRRGYRPTVDSLDPRVLLSGGLSPAQIRQAYSENIDFNVGGRTYAATGAGQTIAIIVGKQDPNIWNDLAIFDSANNLPAPPSFNVVAYSGTPNDDTSDLWGPETAMDVESAHAIAPGANILLIEGFGTNDSAVDWARGQPGVSVISMSWGGLERGPSSADSYFASLPGHNVTFVASSGDDGCLLPVPGTNPPQLQLGVSWPASLPSVLSVGGTTLTTGPNGNYLSETAWSGSNGASGGGYSRYYSEPSYQSGVQHTGARGVPDVAYDGDPSTSITIYNTAPNSSGYKGWCSPGGTSAGAPQWAGLIALANQGRALIGLSPLDGYSQTLPTLYQHAVDFHDITTGNNSYAGIQGYAAQIGWDPVTGLGTPYGVQIVGDLAFHAITSGVTSSSVQTNMGVNPKVSSLPAPTNAAVAALAPASGAPTRPASQGARTPARSIDPSAEVQGPVVLALPLEALPGYSATRRHRELFDSALTSLLSEAG
jgi:subtilase family serine protease